MTAGQFFYSLLKLEVCQIKVSLYFHMDPPVCGDTSCLIARLFGRVNERRGFSNFIHLFILLQVQNGVALYTTLGSLFTLLNLTVFLQHQTGAAQCECAKLALLLLLLALLVW